MWVNPGNNRGATAVRCHHPPRSTRAGATRMARPHTMPSTRTHGRTESARRHPPANMPHLRPRLLLPHERAGHQLPTTHVLLNVVRHGTTTQNQTRITMTLTTRKPTGLPAWPILLIAGVPKAGKSYACAAASASPLVGRTLWVPVGEDDPDELGGIPGADFDIVQHDGTYRGILTAVQDCVTELGGDALPGLLVIDSITRLWNLLSDEAQTSANKRAAAKAAKYGRSAPEGDVAIGMDLWNTAKSRWEHVIDALRCHRGPSIVTARLDQTAVVDERGEPTKEKVWKTQGHKSLPWDVGAIVELTAPGEAVLTGVRSLRVRDAQVARRPFPGFSVDALWRELGLADDAGAGARQHAQLSADASLRADDQAGELQAAKARVWAAWVKASGSEDAESLRADFEQATACPLAEATTAQLIEYATSLEVGKE